MIPPLPDDLRLLYQAKWGGPCLNCGQQIIAGDATWWSPSSKRLVCGTCLALPAGSRPGPVAPPPTNQDAWVRLVRYLKRCVTLQAADGLADFNDTKRWMPLDISVEQIVAGTSGSLPMSKRLEQIAQTLQPGEVLQYGWPTVVVVDRKGITRLAPILVAELEQVDGESLVVAEAATLNPSVMGDECFAAEDVEALTFAFESNQERGHEDMLAAVLDAAASAVGLEQHDLNPRSLSTRLRDTPGLYNTAVVIRAENSAITRSLLQDLADLETRTDWPTTAAAALIDPIAVGQRGPDRDTLASPLALSDAQEQALAASRTSPLTVVTGPPGTGKSQFVVAAVSTAWMDGETSLLASTNNAAVDVAVTRAQQTHPGILLRTGNSAQRSSLAERVARLLADAGRNTPATTDQAVVRAEWSSAYRERKRYYESLAELHALECSMAELAARAGELRRRLWAPPPYLPPDHAIVYPIVRKASTAILFRRRRKRKVLKRFAVVPAGMFDDLLLWAENAVQFDAVNMDRAARQASLGDITAGIEQADSRWQRASAAAVTATVRATLAAQRSAVAGLGAVRTGGNGVASATPTAMRGTRGWACTALSMRPNFPLQAALFDQVIIDEAAQCTLAEALPLAYRARRLVVVGDPNQLTPIVRIDQRTLQGVALSSGLEPEELARTGRDFRTGSAFLTFQHVVGADHVWLLDEHYRCHPLIARWFNSSFYGGLLTVLTDIEGMMDGERGLFWLDVLGTAERGPTGSTRNHREAAAVVEQLEPLIGSGRSVGVVTPFAAQAELIRGMARRRFGNETLASIDFAAATAHRFQGGERDVMIFSSVVAPGIAPRSATWVEDQRNLINVAASRARQHLIVVGHPTAAGEFNLPTLASLRQAALEGLEPTTASWKVHSESERRLLDALHDAGMAPLVKPVEEGYELDFALMHDGGRLNVEVDGEHHLDARGRQRRQDVARDRVLRSLGWTVLRVPAWRCLAEPEVVASEVQTAFTTSRAEHRSGGADDVRAR